jgi:hypothetical protein
MGNFSQRQCGMLRALAALAEERDFSQRRQDTKKKERKEEREKELFLLEKLFV